MSTPAGAASPPGSVVYTRQRLPPPALFVDLERRGWVRYLSKTYTFAHGDAVDVGLVGKDESYEKVSFAIIEEKGDVVVKPRRGATLSYNADDIFTIPSLDSSTGNSLVHRRKIVVPQEAKGDEQPMDLTLVVLTTLTILCGSPSGIPAATRLVELRQFMSGTECLATVSRTYATKKPVAEVPRPMDAMASSKDMYAYIVEGHWGPVLGCGSEAPADETGSAVIPAALVTAREVQSQEFAVPQWLLQAQLYRRFVVEHAPPDAGTGDAGGVVIKVETGVGDDEQSRKWNVVDEFSTSRGELALVASAQSRSGDALVLSRGSNASARWCLRIFYDDDRCAMTESFSFTAAPDFELGLIRIADMLNCEVSWQRKLLAAHIAPTTFGSPTVRSPSDVEQLRHHLVESKWEMYLERGHGFKSGDNLADEVAVGADAKKCIAVGLAFAMPVPFPGFFLVGGLGGAVVAAPPVQAQVSRYMANQLAHRFVMSYEDAHGDVLLSKEVNYMGQSWKEMATYSYKAGDFEFLPCRSSLSGEQLHINYRVNFKGRVLKVHEFISVERLGRGVSMVQTIMAGQELLNQTNRYYEYSEGSLRERSTLQPFVPSESTVATQFEWVEENVDEWLVAHESEVLEEAKALHAKAQGNEQLMQSSSHLFEMLETATKQSSTYAEAQGKLQGLEANSKVDMSQVVSLGHSLVADLALQASQMDDKAREQARADATKVGAELRTLADGSDGIQKALHQGEMHYTDKSQELGSAAEAAESSRMYGLQLAHLHHEGERIIADISTPEEALAALKQNPAFVQEVQLLALNYIVRDNGVLPRHALKNLLFVRQEDTVCSTQIPKVLGEKEWGTYSIDGLAINRFTIDPECVVPTVDEGVRIHVTGIIVEFDSFTFELQKVTFPKVSDAGLATATSKFSADVSFDVVTDADRNIKVDNLEATVAIEELVVTVVKANHRWKLNKVLGFFSERVRTIVEAEILLKVQEGVEVLDENLGSTITKLMRRVQAKGATVKQHIEEGSPTKQVVAEGVPDTSAGASGATESA